LPPVNNFKYFLKTLITYHQESILDSYEPDFEISNNITKTCNKNKIIKNNQKKIKILFLEYLQQYIPDDVMIVNEDEELEKVLIDYLVEDGKQIFTIRDVRYLKDELIVILNRIHKSFCLLCLREHESDNAYLTINVFNRKVFY